MPNDASQVCAVCARPLERFEEVDGTTSWIHASDLFQDKPDHVVVPVGTEDVTPQLRCDFCQEEDPRWVLPVQDFEVDTGQGSSSDWACCDTCRDHVEKGDWNGVTRRALAAFEQTYGKVDDVIETSLKSLYRQVRKNITGSVRPLS